MYYMSKYSLLSGKDHLAEVQKERRNLLAELNQEEREAYQKLSAEADARNPNRTKHRVSLEDVEGILKELAKLPIITNAKNSRGNSAYISGDLALSNYAKATGKHSEWVKSIKHRSFYGSEFKDVFRNLRGRSKDVEVSHYYSNIKEKFLAFDGSSINQILDQMQEAYMDALEKQLLRQQVAELQLKVSEYELTIAELESSSSEHYERITRFESHSIHWKDKAVMLKAQDRKITQTELAEACGVSKSSIRDFMKLSDTKSLIESKRFELGLKQ